jgi:hypothetical protein
VGNPAGQFRSAAFAGADVPVELTPVTVPCSLLRVLGG